MRNLILLVGLAIALCSPAFANTPGKHSVTLTWTDPDPGVTFNIYRGSATGVCSGTPTPFATGVVALTYNDSSVTAGQTYVYAVSAVKGGESTCSAEVQISVPTSPTAPSNLQGTTQ